MARAQPTELRKQAQQTRQQAKAREMGKGKGKGKGPSRRDPDFEHAGVGIAIRKKWLNNIKEVKEVSGRVMVVTLAAVGGDIHFVSVYAPPADHKLQKKEAFYDELSQTIAQLHGIIYIGGDFNARLYEILEHEEEVLGQNIVLRKGYVTTQEKGKGIGENTRENRDLFVGFLKAQGLTPMNTQFKKPPEKLVTYKEKVPEHNPESELYQGENTGPYDHSKYAQCDYLLVKKGFQKTVTDCESRVDLAKDTDHIPLVAEIRTNMKRQQKAHGEKAAKKYYKPSTEKWRLYNESIRDSLAAKKGWTQEADMSRNPATLEEWGEILTASAEGTLDAVDPEIKKDYITKETWDKIQKRNDLQKAGDPNREVNKLSKEIKKEAFQSRKQKKLEEFNENPKDKNKKDLWKAVKNLRAKYTPKYIQMRNRAGMLVPLNKRAETIAEYLEKDHWSNPVEAGRTRNPSAMKVIPARSQEQKDEQRKPFELKELRAALKKAKRNKEPGPDGVRMELLKWLSEENLKALLGTINQWWENKKAPPQLYFARIATIYKKGDTDKAGNYRPISLLSSFYKVYMTLIRERIQAGIEQLVSKTQYGFRPAKSTSHAIFLIKRIQEFAESTGNPLYMTLLDWEKAFDKVDHRCLCKALERFDVHPEVIEALQDGYENATFYVRDQFGKSEARRQEAGIRQGCPLSPYLFVLVMACVDFDIQQSLTTEITDNRIPGTDFDMVYYADDTIIVSRSLEACNQLIELTEAFSEQYGLKLNKSKCVNMNMNADGEQAFASGEAIKTEKEAMYLGNQLNYKADPQAEVTQKLQEVQRTLFRMQDYWKAAEASPKWKVLIFEAVLKSKLLYGLETSQLTNKCIKRIDAFQIRGLRKILNMKHTYWDRTATNKRILQEATKVTFKTGTPEQVRRNQNREVKPFSVTWQERRQKLMGHIIRTSEEDPLRQVVLKPNEADPKDVGRRRSGHPRKGWVSDVYKSIWKKHRHLVPRRGGGPFRRKKYKGKRKQHNHIEDWARQRRF